MQLSRVTEFYYNKLQKLRIGKDGNKVSLTYKREEGCHFYCNNKSRHFISPDEGITGNSHFMFEEMNNDVIAEHIENWIKSKNLV